MEKAKTNKYNYKLHKVMIKLKKKQYRVQTTYTYQKIKINKLKPKLLKLLYTHLNIRKINLNQNTTINLFEEIYHPDNQEIKLTEISSMTHHIWYLP